MDGFVRYAQVVQIGSQAAYSGMEPMPNGQAWITLENVILFCVSFASDAAVKALIQRWPYHAIDQVVHTQMSAQRITEDRAFVGVS